MSTPDLAIEVQNLNKVYAASGKMPEKHALKDLNLSIPRGSIFGLLGPNGAGKSTFINTLAGMVTKTSGDVADNLLINDANAPPSGAGGHWRR